MNLTAILVAAMHWLRRLLRGEQASDVLASPPPTGQAPIGVPTAPGTPELHSRFGGRAWRFDEHGVHTDGTLWRTPGEPVTCRAILALYAAPMLASADRHGVNPALILMTIAAEAGSLRRFGFTGPASFRWEGHVLNRDLAKPFKGTYSAGPMQVLATTVRDLVSRHGAAYGLDLDAFAIAPAYGKCPVPAPLSHALYDPVLSIELGAAVIRLQLSLTGDDPILVAAAYNSGGLYRSSANAWRLRSHGDHLDRAARWYGDACAVLREAGIAWPRR